VLRRLLASRGRHFGEPSAPPPREINRLRAEERRTSLRSTCPPGSARQRRSGSDCRRDFKLAIGFAKRGLLAVRNALVGRLACCRRGVERAGG